MSESVYVADVADDVDNTDCLLLTGTYVQGDSTGDCTDQLWYFVTGTKLLLSQVSILIIYEIWN